MRAWVVSDIHLEFSDARLRFRVPDLVFEQADVAVLAGDIHVGTKGLEWAHETFAASGIPVVYVPGNHEFYGGHISKVSIEMAKVAQELGIHLLDNSTTVIDDPKGSGPDHGVRFIGATLWTDFRLFGNSPAMIGDCMHEAKNYITDFSCITFGSTGWMTPSDSVKLHLASREYIERELEKKWDGKTVLVTHHCVSMKSVHKRYADQKTSAAFSSNLDDIVKRVDMTIHGHTHCSFDYKIEDARVVCNPRGYPVRGMKGRRENPDFDPGLIVEV